MLRIFYSTTIWLVIFTFCRGQIPNLDSLEMVLDTTSTLADRIELHIKLGAFNRLTDERKAYTNINRAVFLADSADNIEKYARALYFKSTIHQEFLRNVEALEVLDTLQTLLDGRKSEFDLNYHAKMSLRLESTKSGLLTNLERFEDAIEIMINLFSVIEKMYEKGTVEFDQEMAFNYFNLGHAYSKNVNDSLSVYYLHLAIDNFKKINYYPSLIGGAYLTLAESLENLGAPFEDVDSALDSALFYSRLDQYTANQQGFILAFKCAYYSANDSLTEGISICNEALELGESSLDSNALMSLYWSIGKNHQLIKEYNEAEKYFLKSLQISTNSKYEFGQYPAIRELGTNYLLQKRYRKSAESFNEYIQYVEGFYKDRISQNVLEAEEKYKAKEKEAQIAQQHLQIIQQKNSRNLIIGGSVISLLILFTLFFTFYQDTRRKRRQNEAALDQERRRSKDLEDLANLKTDFFNNVSHELRTPLTLVIAPLEELTQSIKNVNAKKQVDLALSNSRRLLGLTNEILDLSKIDGSKLELEHSELELGGFLKRVFYSFESLAKSRNIKLEYEQIDKPLNVRIDANKLEKVLTNLVSNAIKYSSDGSKVKMDVRSKSLINNTLHINIIDNGSGIAKDDLTKVFDRFYQTGRASRSSGTGIGLALTKELVELMKGTIKVESKEGEGSTFTIEIPIETLAELSHEQDEESIKKPKSILYKPILINKERPRILIVEDDLQMSDYLVSILGDDYYCEQAYNGKQAIEKLEKNHYDLISSDVMMPEMDGFEFKEMLRNDQKLRNISFILLTARFLEEDKLRGLQLGVDDYITKPFSTSEYRARVHNLLKNKVEREEFRAADKNKAVDDQPGILKRAETIVMTNLDDSSFSVEALAKELNYSRRQLGRIIQHHSGMSPVTFILEIRLQMAYRLIKDRKYSTVNEVRYDVGIDSPSYFTTKFNERFGINPASVRTEE